MVQLLSCAVISWRGGLYYILQQARGKNNIVWVPSYSNFRKREIKRGTSLRTPYIWPITGSTLHLCLSVYLSLYNIYIICMYIIITCPKRKGLLAPLYSVQVTHYDATQIPYICYIKYIQYSFNLILLWVELYILVSAGYSFRQLDSTSSLVLLYTLIHAFKSCLSKILIDL